MIPIATGPVLLHVPMATTWIYVILANFVALIDHSGFDFTLSSAAHDLHHEKFLYNFGGCGWLDFIHGTLYQQRAHKMKNK